MNTPTGRLGGRSDLAALVVASAAAVLVFWLGLAYGSRAATGADTFGYVSQAYLWLKGDLQLEQPLSRELPWPHQEQSLTPLGYRPGEVRHTIVPIYAPGVPLLMAGFELLFDACGPYYVTPVFAALLVAGTFVLGWRLTREPAVAAVAAVLMASSPAFLFNLMFPMSDIVTAALWTWTLALLTWPPVAVAAVAGGAAGVAVIVRPNLVPLAIAGAAAAVLWPAGGMPLRRRVGRGVAFAAAIVPAALFVAAVNRSLYGSALQSGYGSTSSLYAFSHFGTNITQFTRWLLESESVFVAAAVMPILWKRVRPDWLTPRGGAPLALFAAIAIGAYLFYLPFDAWWYLRFLLPVFPLLFLFQAVGITWIARVMPMPRLAALILVMGLLCVYRGAYVARGEFLKLGYGEQRYVAVGQFVDRALPRNAVILAMQHSGSIRYYSGRLTIRYDMFSPGRFPSVIEWLQARGYRPYILLEDWEEKQYRARMDDGRTALGRLELRVLAEMTAPVKVRIYDPVPSAGITPPPDPIFIRPSRACVGPGGVWAQ
jgi:hypothetical protein